VPALPGMAALDMAAAEDGIVRSTREAVAGLVLAQGWAGGDDQAVGGWWFHGLAFLIWRSFRAMMRHWWQQLKQPKKSLHSSRLFRTS
jgi:hypothetical protein